MVLRSAGRKGNQAINQVNRTLCARFVGTLVCFGGFCSRCFNAGAYPCTSSGARNWPVLDARRCIRVVGTFPAGKSSSISAAAAVAGMTADDLHSLEEASSAIKVEGERYPATHAKLIDR